MKIWDKIKEHFFKLFHEEIKQLPESTVEKVSENSGEIWRENLKLEENQLTKQINEPNQSQLDKAIFQYMDAYYDEWKNAKEQGRDCRSSYGILIRLNGKYGEKGVNDVAELNLLNYIKQYNKEFEFFEQQPHAFYHIHHGKYDIDENSQMKLYLNTDRENVANLAFAIMQELNNEPYYFKILTDYQMEKSNRTEKIVFYTDEKKAKDLCNKLIILKQNYPRLFSGSEYTNPFVKKEAGFIGISSDPRSDKFIDLHGNSKIIAQSSNSLIAEALQDSMTIAMGQIISKDKSLSEKTDFAVYDFDKYMAVYPELRLNYGNQLLGNMKKFLKKSKENNKDLNIDGLGERINEGMEI